MRSFSVLEVLRSNTLYLFEIASQLFIFERSDIFYMVYFKQSCIFWSSAVLLLSNLVLDVMFLCRPTIRLIMTNSLFFMINFKHEIFQDNLHFISFLKYFLLLGLFFCQTKVKYLNLMTFTSWIPV